MTTAELTDVAEGIAKIKHLIRDHGESKKEVYEHYLRMVVKQFYLEGLEEIICLINRVYKNPLKRKEYTDYLFSAAKAKEIL